jgi:2-C-methyl-D-erythritol 4-phosphate cytidylyltransferase
MTREGIDCIVLAAGIAKRMGKDMPKQFLRIGGKPVMIHVLEKLDRSGFFKKIIVTVLESHEKVYRELIEQYNIKNVELVPGGATRQDSTYNGLKAVSTDRVFIHEAARPFIDKEFIELVIGYSDPAVVPVLPIDFTVSVGDEFMSQALDREYLRNVQLPQAFDTAILRKAHEKAIADNFIAHEDSTLVFRLNEKVRFVPGRKENIKITDPYDLIIAERILYSRDDLMA